jgi:hypothetical protein
MVVSSAVHHLLERAAAMLPASDEELICKGIAAGVSERLLELKKAQSQLQKAYGSLEALEQDIKATGVSSHDHTTYTALLEWRAMHHELAQLLHLLETL